MSAKTDLEDAISLSLLHANRRDEDSVPTAVRILENYLEKLAKKQEQEVLERLASLEPTQ